MHIQTFSNTPAIWFWIMYCTANDLDILQICIAHVNIPIFTMYAHE